MDHHHHQTAAQSVDSSNSRTSFPEVASRRAKSDPTSSLSSGEIDHPRASKSLEKGLSSQNFDETIIPLSQNTPEMNQSTASNPMDGSISNHHQTAAQASDSSNSSATSPKFTSRRPIPTLEARRTRNPHSSVADLALFPNRTHPVIFYGISGVLAYILSGFLYKLALFFLILAIIRYVITPLITNPKIVEYFSSSHLSDRFKVIPLWYSNFIYILMPTIFLYALVACLSVLVAFHMILESFVSFLYMYLLCEVFRGSDDDEIRRSNNICFMGPYTDEIQKSVLDTIRLLLRAIVPTGFLTWIREEKQAEASFREQSKSADHQGLDFSIVRAPIRKQSETADGFDSLSYESASQFADGLFDETTNYLHEISSLGHDSFCSIHELLNSTTEINQSRSPKEDAVLNMSRQLDIERTSNYAEVPSTSYRDSSVILTINSFKVPTFDVKVPEKTITQFVKMAISNEVNTLFAGGTGIIVLHRGQTLEEDYRVSCNVELDVIFMQNDPTKSLSYLMDEQRTTVPVETVITTDIDIDQSLESSIPKRRRNNPFNIDEVEALVLGVENFGTRSWAKIQRNYEIFHDRTSRDLQDKWKSLLKTAKLTPDKRRGVEIPQELLDRVLDIAARSERQNPNVLVIATQSEHQNPNV